MLQHAPHFRKDLVFRGAPHARAHARVPSAWWRCEVLRTARSSVAYDRAGQTRIIPNCVRMEATLKPFHSQNASFYPILIDIPDTFFGGWIGGWIVGMAPIHVIPHALLVTLVAQRPFRICSATRWIMRFCPARSNTTDDRAVRGGTGFRLYPRACACGPRNITRSFRKSGACCNTLSTRSLNSTNRDA